MEANDHSRLRSAAWVAIFAAVATVGVASCTRQPEAARHTVDEYRANPDLRREQFARCANDPGTLGQTPDCVNARQATRLEETRSVRDLPPVQLPQPGSPRPDNPRK